ncbi:hypothetical protein AB835_00685 [Candidatus Endobugula sertula]|uniref:Contractile injection system tube protein N-terminal domain-containing protein n=1 Tax=Candidatus Endobugula sertula TaxID=62101 RepID=A0A1D2QTY9_9GAMM|nr:hypothetical protein AB835_00685 [Candidatus Endobugula sertula]
MAELLKATLQEVSADSNQNAIGDPVPVQFNPSSLKLKLHNKTEGGRSRGRQRRQHNGASSTVLSMDLVFDSADEGSNDTPVSVRTKTAIVEKYVLPKEDTSDTPPRLQFQWDELIIAGIVESVDIDFEHFAANGAPLRAKVSLSIKEQEPKYTYVEGASGPAAKDSSHATIAGSGNSSGTSPGAGTNTSVNENNTSNNSDRSATALDGETPADFLARQGLDPSAWRGLDIDLSAGLGLEAGIEVGFNASLGAAVGVGVSVGVQANAGVSLEASLGLNGSAVFSGTAAASAGRHTDIPTDAAVVQSSGASINGDAAGLALSAAGGVQSAMETAKMNEIESASSAAQAAFGLSKSNVPSNTASVSAASTNITSTTTESPSTQTLRQTPTSLSSQSETRVDHSGLVNTQELLPKADPRSASYGYGVPLRPIYPTALVQQDTIVCKSTYHLKRTDGGPQFRKQKTTPAWEALPKRDPIRSVADTAKSRHQQKPSAYINHGCHCD